MDAGLLVVRAINLQQRGFYLYNKAIVDKVGMYIAVDTGLIL